MKNPLRGVTMFEWIPVVFWLVLAGVFVYGWVANIVKLAHMCCEVSGMLVLRVVGIFVAPLGVVMGFL